MFCFGTRLTRITRELARQRVDAALEEAARTVVDWDGGTRIGQSLDTFVRKWGRGGLCRGGVVVICSDGLDRGDPEVLALAMERLGRLCHRIVWLNPHKGDNRDFRPSTLGMMVAAPHIDLLLSGHDLASLEELAERCAEQLPERLRGASHRGERRRVAAEGVASGIGTSRYGARLIVVAERGRHRGAPRSRGGATAGLPGRSSTEAVSEAEEASADPARLARGYPFRGCSAAGPRRSGGVRRHVQAGTRRQAGELRGHLRRPRRRPVGGAVPVQAPAGRRAGSSRAGSKWKVYVCTYEVPGGTSAHREQIARELIAVYRPSCNEQQYDHAWKDEWIGEYSAAPDHRPGHPPRPRSTAKDLTDSRGQRT